MNRIRNSRGARLFALAWLGLAAVAAARADDFRNVTRFEHGDARLLVTIKFKDSGDKSGLFTLSRGNHGGTLFFRPEDWPEVVRDLAAAMAAAGETRQVAELVDNCASRFRIGSGDQGGQPVVRLTMRDNPGGKNPDVVVELPPADFAEFRRALDVVAKELAKK